MGRGTLLAGRYRLDDLLAESEGARFWRATDTVLARSVAIHAVPSDDERAPALLDAARVSATVTDPHLLRVLDCDDDAGITWVVNEWGDGVSLDLMLEQGTLPPSRAAWLAREVAEAIAAGHAQGIAHGRLNPEAVLVTHAGAVKLIGYVVDASLDRPRPPDPLYGELDEREADVINLAGILYAALTGRWPGVAPSDVPRAPREGRRPLRPRQVRAGVPRTLDVICERVLHQEASQHAMPIETAHEIAAALADYLGESGLAAPFDVAGMHAEPTVSLHRDALPHGVGDGTVEAGAEGGPAAAASVPVNAPGAGGGDAGERADDRQGTMSDEPVSHEPVSDPEATRTISAADLPTEPAPFDPEATQAVRVPTAAETGSSGSGTDSPSDPPSSSASDPGTPPPGSERTEPEPTQAISGLAASGASGKPDESDPAPDPEATAYHQEVPTGFDQDPEALAPRSRRQASPPPPFEDLPERPLFADGERRVPEAARAAAQAQAAAGITPPHQSSEPGVDTTAGGTSDTGAGFWPFTDEEEAKSEVHTGKEGRGWLRTAIVVGVLIVLVIAMAVAFNRGRQDGGTAGTDDGTSQSPSAAAGPVEIAGVRDFDPAGDPPEENPESVGNAIDGDPATEWTTLTYRGNPELGGLKPGVGLMLDLGSEQQVSAVTVEFANSPTSVEVYAAPEDVTKSPDSLDQLDRVGGQDEAPAKATLQLDPKPTTRYLLVWLTKLPPAEGGFRGEISDITVRS